jgi:hypothetical protein
MAHPVNAASRPDDRPDLRPASTEGQGQIFTRGRRASWPDPDRRRRQPAAAVAPERQRDQPGGDSTAAQRLDQFAAENALLRIPYGRQRSARSSST